MQKIKIMGVSGSPRRNGNTVKLVEKALEGAMTVAGVAAELYEMAGKRIHHCTACYKCFKTGACTFKDDFQEFNRKFMEADAVIWGSPVYHMGIPASMKAALDRLGNADIGHWTKLGRGTPRYSKVCGVLSVGASRYGGQEMVLNFLIDSSLLMNGIVVAGDTSADNYVGAISCSRPALVRETDGIDWLKRGDSVLDDVTGVAAAMNLGKRVAETARIVKAGMSALETELPAEYFYSWEEL